MHKPLMPALLFCLLSVAAACQSYTKGLQESVTRADETAAIAALRTVSVAQRTYSVSNGGSYGTFGQLVQSGYLDSRFSSDKPTFKGYALAMTLMPAADLAAGAYSVSADPEAPQEGRHFYMDSSSGLIHVNAAQPAGAGDPSLDQ